MIFATESAPDLANLCVREVRLRLGNAWVLDGVNIALGARQSLAVMGSSGSGKTSLLHVLSGLLSPDEGSVQFGATELTSLTEKERRAFRLEHVGFVFQSGDLIPELTLAENVALPLLLKGESRRGAQARAIDALDSVGLASLARRRPAETSGGQRQRAAVARALVHHPLVVFADEPTGALDADSGELVMSLFLRRASEDGAAVVVTHDSNVANRCGRTLHLVDGKLTAEPDLSHT